VRALREVGHDVPAVCEFAKRTQDQEVMDLSARENRVLITEDKDFGQLAYAQGRPSRAIILIRYPVPVRQRLTTDIVKLVQQKGEALQGSFVVLEPGRVRVARLPRDA
jgi:predicted nuclease of predicted toxin-antitoxin system